MILPHRGEIHTEFESVKKMCHPYDFASDTPMLTTNVMTMSMIAEDKFGVNILSSSVLNF